MQCNNHNQTHPDIKHKTTAQQTNKQIFLKFAYAPIKPHCIVFGKFVKATNSSDKKTDNECVVKWSGIIP